MEQNRSKKTLEGKREKTKKKNVPEKKTKSDILAVSSGSLTDPSLDTFYIVGKGYGCGRTKANESGYRLYECYSEANIKAHQESSQNFKDVIHCEGLHPVASNSSFLSAKSDVSETFQKQIHEMEDKLAKKNLVINSLKKQIGQKEIVEVNSVGTETEKSDTEISKLKELEKKISNRDKKIKELNQKVEEWSTLIETRNEENNIQKHKLSLLNRQLQSMYELLGKQKWNSIDPTEFVKYKNKTAELESSVAVLEEEKGKLIKKTQKLSSQLENKEVQLNAKNRELVEYKNRSTLEMCKLINEIDFYKNEADKQKQLFDSKILEVQTSMEEEIVSITEKLEEQYQKDVATAIEKQKSNFERLASLSKGAIEQLLRFSQPDKFDMLSYQKQWDVQQTLLESKIVSMEGDHSREIQQLKDNYESKIVFLKTQIEALQSQLKERKDIIDIFENELVTYKTNSSMNLLKASTLGDDISALKELYTAEIFSQKQIHKLQLDIFEEKVKTLTEEILFHAKKEEIQMQELERARTMVGVFREKYELLVYEWEDKIKKDFEATSAEAEIGPVLDSTLAEFRSLMTSLKKSEQVQEERIKMLETKSNDERISFLQDIEGFKAKLQDFGKFQNAQTKLDETIHNLIKAVGTNYSRTVETLLMSHMTEVSLKHMELCASEKRHIEEIDGLKNDHEKEIEELRNRAENLNEAKIVAENKLASLKGVNNQQEVKALRKQTQDISIECIKSEGMIAVKEETEKALSERIKELEDVIQKKEENCRKELEDLMAKYMKSEILASSKDDLVKEMEEQLNETETRLEKSFKEIERLTELCSRIGNDVTEDEETFKKSKGFEEKFREAKAIGESLETKLNETFEGLKEWTFGDVKENDKIKERSELAEELKQKEKILEEQREKLLNFERKAKLEFEREKNEILAQVILEKEEKENALKQNELLEKKIQTLDERVDALTLELAKNAEGDRGEVFSISLQEVRFLYEEEQEVETSIASYKTKLPRNLQVNVLEENEKLRQENETLKLELKQRVNVSGGVDFQEDVFSKIRNIQEELREVTNERDELLAISESLGKERMRLREELEKLNEENRLIRARYQTRIDGTAIPNDSRQTEMNAEIGKLTEYIKTLSKKLETMKANNELLLSESREHLRHNQNLVNELEEAWNQRYEIEDQLTKVRKENALLNMHRRKLEETNERISSLISESKPSVAYWIKIHETVENIVDEVLALKTSFSDSGSVSGASTVVEPPRTNSELKIMTETLHTQLKNKTMLCDELILQKESLERELKNLEKMIQNDAGHSGRRRRFDSWNKDPEHGLSETHDPCNGDYTIDESNENPESSHLNTLKLLKKHLQDQVQLEEEQFRENLELEIEELKKEIQTVEESPGEKCLINDDVCLKSIETKYEEEVAELTKEFEKEVEKLKETFGSDKEEEEDYGKEIEKLKKYFEGKWKNLEKRYTEIYKIEKEKTDPEINEIVERLQEILSLDDPERTSKLTGIVKDILSRRMEEVKTLREKYEEAVAGLEFEHDSEVQKLQGVVLQLRENIMQALKKESGEEGNPNEDLIGRIRGEYEEKLEEEKKKLSDLLEDARLKHEREMISLEEFWTEKLSECETKCAMMKATGGGRKGKSREECQEEFEQPETEKMSQALSEEKQIVKHKEGGQDFDSGDFERELKLREGNPRESLCVSCLTNPPFFKRMELKTDDDKLDVIQQKNTLEEMIFSMRNIITKLLAYVGQQKSDVLNLSNSTFDIDDTMYKSIQFDLDRTASDVSMVSNSIILAKDLSSIFQEIKDNSLLSSSDQVRFELEKCLKQVKKDATCLLALSCPENSGQNVAELVKKVEREKNELEAKVLKVEEMQIEMRKEISTTKERLSQWERNLEVVSEGYGEEIVEPKQIISLTDVKEKLKAFLTENCGHSPQDINLLDEICKEGDRLQKEWTKEKCDLQQQGWGSNAKRDGQIDVADKQVHSLKRFLEEQAVEREQEREAFDREINQLRESLKAKERDSSLQNRTNREVGRLSVMSLADESVEALVSQMKELTAQLTETERNKEAVEGEFQNAVKKIWSLREVIQDLELQLAEVCERECNLKKKVEKLEGLIEQQSKAEKNLKEELETCRTQTEFKYSEHLKSLEEELIRLRHVADQVNPESLTQLKANLRQIEGVLMKKTKDLEQLHVSSANVSCSSPSEDVSIRDHLDATRCSTPDEMCSNEQPMSMMLPMEEVDRVHEKLARHTRAEEVAMKYIRDLKMQLRTHRKAYEEVQTERDILLEKVDVYLKENSSLKVRLEEQRCNAGLLQKQLNANLESQINRLEVDVEKLNEMCNEKDKQLRDMKVILENTTKSLKVRETEALNKSKEENALIVTLKTDLANALNENEKLEDTLEKTKEKLRESMKMPALIDSMIEEKNAEIDRLEKEVARLSYEKNSSGVSSRGNNSEERGQKRRIRFSEPESFSENISSISVQCLSDLRNCSDSFTDFRNSSFKTKRNPGCSTKLESISSIAPLQLSPRGADSPFNWKTSSPIFQTSNSPSKSPSSKPDLHQMEETSKLQEEIELKQREISELHLEIDKLKRQLVEAGQEVATAKSQWKEAQSDLAGKEEEIRKLKNGEESLMMTIDRLKKNHGEEVEELENKIKFEHGKVEMVYEEIKALEVKKIEIEEAFFSLREDYNEKINGEKKTVEGLLHRIRSLEARNGELELKIGELGKELEKTMRESENTAQALTIEINDLKCENDKIRLVSSQKVDAGTQMEEEVCVCQGAFTLEIPAAEGSTAPLKENLTELKTQFDKMAAVIGEKDFNKKDAFLYATTVRRLLTVVLNRVDELTKDVEAHMKKVMECSVDDLALKVQRELVLSAKLDNQLLSSIEANGYASKDATPQPDSLDVVETRDGEMGGGDAANYAVPKPLGNAALVKVAGLYRDATNKMGELVKEREELRVKVSEQQKIIRLLEESLRKEKDRILEEKDRCAEDAKIMELLRVNLEKRMLDVKTKERELRKEKQQRMTLEREVEDLKKQGTSVWENKKLVDLTAQLESQKEKLLSVGKLLEEEKKKNQELGLSLEEERIERITEKNARRLVESDLSILTEEKENLKMELLNSRELLHSRNVEIGLLKRKINLQEIDIKALSVAKNVQNSSETSSLADLELIPESPTSLLLKMKKLNSCVQRHVRESSGMGEALFQLSQETEQMREILRKLEDNETKGVDETLLADVELERKLWALERGKLVMDVETLKRENEILKHDLVGTSKSNELLKLENAKLKKGAQSPRKEGVTSLVENGFLQERVSHLTRKYMRTESYRKALAWQKHYLLITLHEYQRSEEEAWRKIGRRKRDGKRKPQKPSRFRVVALAILSIFRMKFIVKKWQRNSQNHVLSLLESQTNKLKSTPLASVLNIYNEPVNPLSYQTQNIFHRGSSQVLRTPPSRDPGPQSFAVDLKNVPERLEPFDYRHENVGILKGLP